VNPAYKSAATAPAKSPTIGTPVAIAPLLLDELLPEAAALALLLEAPELTLVAIPVADPELLESVFVVVAVPVEDDPDEVPVEEADPVYPASVLLALAACPVTLNC